LFESTFGHLWDRLTDLVEGSLDIDQELIEDLYIT
jgi:hypothetical protein